MALVERESIAWAASGAAANDLMAFPAGEPPDFDAMEEIGQKRLERFLVSIELHKWHVLTLKGGTNVDL